MTLFMLAGDDEEDSCGVNLINEGVTVSGDCVRVQFTGCGGVESYQCKLNDGSFTTCKHDHGLYVCMYGMYVCMHNYAWMAVL